MLTSDEGFSVFIRMFPWSDDDEVVSLLFLPLPLLYSLPEISFRLGLADCLRWITEPVSLDDLFFWGFSIAVLFSGSDTATEESRLLEVGS